MLNIVLFGAPGCGKGTQAAKLKEKYGINHVSTGEIIRSEIRRGTELGKQVAWCIEHGQLAPDEVVTGIIAEYVAANLNCEGNIYDGYPRTTNQAQSFDTILDRHGLAVDLMIYMEVPEEELVQRILLRGKESGRADDASEEVIRTRIETYRAQTAVVADHYSAQGKYEAVNGLGTVDEVFGRICAVIDKHVK